MQYLAEDSNQDKKEDHMVSGIREEQDQELANKDQLVKGIRETFLPEN